MVHLTPLTPEQYKLGFWIMFWTMVVRGVVDFLNWLIDATRISLAHYFNLEKVAKYVTIIEPKFEYAKLTPFKKFIVVVRCTWSSLRRGRTPEQVQNTYAGI